MAIFLEDATCHFDRTVSFAYYILSSAGEVCAERHNRTGSRKPVIEGPSQVSLCGKVAVYTRKCLGVFLG
jgi:hypothetical protein